VNPEAYMHPVIRPDGEELTSLNHRESWAVETRWAPSYSL